MKAAVYRRLGPADQVLHVTGLETPRPDLARSGFECRSRGVNPTDVKDRASGPGKAMPFDVVVAHHDGVGEIDAVGAGSILPGLVWIYFAAHKRPRGTAAQWTCRGRHDRQDPRRAPALKPMAAVVPGGTRVEIAYELIAAQERAARRARRGRPFSPTQ
jgi:hypothetical protein